MCSLPDDRCSRHDQSGDEFTGHEGSLCEVGANSALYGLRGGGILKSTTVIPWPPARIDFMLVGGG